MQRQNMIFIFFIAILSLIFVGYVFVIGDEKTEKGNKESTTTKENITEEKLEDCTFSKKYNLLLAINSKDQEYIFITLKDLKEDEVVTVRVRKDLMPSLKKDNYYLFNFKTNKRVHNHIDEIFKTSELLKVEIVKDDVLENPICQSHLIED